MKAFRTDSRNGKLAGFPLKALNEIVPPVSGCDCRREVIATLSFPVDKTQKGSRLNNTEAIAEVILRRRPLFMLCAGWSVPDRSYLLPVKRASLSSGSTVVLEVAKDYQSFRVENGNEFCMGAGFFSSRNETNREPERIRRLVEGLGKRSFALGDRTARLLICGEITLLQGRINPHFHQGVSAELADALQCERVLILNPTHTRMGNSGTIKAWRRFLSEGNRAYLSSSNWDVSTGQKPSGTLHSFWLDGKSREAIDTFESDLLVYREWRVPTGTPKRGARSRVESLWADQLP